MAGLGTAAGSAGALVLAGALCGCISRSPGPEDWLSTSFRTPLSTVEAFQDALAGDLPDLEYRCLSSAFRARHGVSSLAYRTQREELPFFRQMADAEILEVRPLGPRSVEVLGRVSKLGFDRRFRLRLVREDFYEIRRGDELVGDGLAAFEELVELRQDAFGSAWAQASAPVPEGLGLAEVTEVRVGQDWKIDDFEILEPPPDP